MILKIANAPHQVCSRVCFASRRGILHAFVLMRIVGNVYIYVTKVLNIATSDVRLLRMYRLYVLNTDDAIAVDLCRISALSKR